MAAPAPTRLLVDDLSVALGGAPIVDGASFGAARGEWVALMAPSGAGKTTLLRGIVGLAPTTGGRVLLDGEAYDGDRLPILRRRCVFVAQRPVMPAGTVEDTLRAPFTYAAADGERYDPERARALLDATGLSPDRLTDTARRLSEGQAKRVSVVRALLLAPRALLLDEPTAGLDAAATERVVALLRRETEERGLACVVVTHLRDVAHDRCDRALDISACLRGSAT